MQNTPAPPADWPERLRNAYPWTGQWLEVDGGQMHVLDEGPRDAPVILAVHGNPTWSFYWRALVHAFSNTHRVIVPDHIGCGWSDKPQSWSYLLAQHERNLGYLIDTLDLRHVTLVVHDWGGAIGVGAAARCPERIDRVVITNTAAWPSLRIPPSIASVKIPAFGPLAVRGFNAFAGIATVRATAKGLDPIAREGLVWPYRSWHDRIATLRFVQDIPLHKSHPSYETLADIEDRLPYLQDKPMLIAWGERDFCFTPAFRKGWERRFPNARVHAWSDVGHYVMEDAPDRMVAAITDFMTEAPTS